jgi:hypothetical protein
MAPRPSLRTNQTGGSWNLLTFERMVAGEIILLVYWAGLGVIALIGFGMVGAGVGLAIRDGSLAGLLLGAPLLIGGLLAMVALTLLWRATCEFYIAIFRISEDLRSLRRNDEAAAAARTTAPGRPPVTPPAAPTSASSLNSL